MNDLRPCRTLQNNTFFLGEKGGPAEADAGQLMRQALVDIASSGKTKVLTALDSHTNTTNLLVNTAATVAVDMIAAQVEPRPQWKDTLCSKLYGLGFDERFWWIN